ncbi:hybrid sensor histidine kinase/response regulator transcription factor [Spirosoma endbachense]|uniref:histidine kinase n=1 Tax=Spirosoma endbachense TaxID=2666025 RepID=A0A6P1VQE6_9BACT|nr:tetratricopeptide repeat protein [Spirosoma endbachense]QHV95313.1 tetratricopeptide repeat protein [Spirosoma endbachense]
MAIRLLALLFSLFFLASPQLAIAQQSKRDSLDNLLKHAGPDTNRVLLLTKAVGVYYTYNPQQAKKYADEAMQLAQKLGYGRGIGRSYISLGIYHWFQGNYQTAMHYTKKAIPYFEELKDEDGLASAYGNIGINYKGMGDFSRATEYSFKSLKLWEKVGNQARIAYLLNNIGVLLKGQQKYDQALYYLRQSYTKSEGIEPNHQAGVLVNMGSICIVTKDYPKAISYLIQARTRYAALNEPSGLVICDNNLGETYARLGQYAKAEMFLQRALQLGNQLNDKDDIMGILLALGDIRLKTSRAAESFAYFDKVYVLASESKDNEKRLIVYKGLETANAQTGNFAKAYQFLSKWVALNDSVFGVENAKKIARIQAEYQSEKKQAEIELLKKDQQVSRLWRNSIGTGLLALLLIAGLVVSRQRLKIHSDQVLLDQSKLVAEKNSQLEIQTHLLENQAVTLTEQAHQLQELDAVKSRFFTNITHEFRTPLTLIMGTLSAKMYELTTRPETTLHKNEATVMQRNAQRLLRLINQLLDLAKLESGRLDLQTQTGDLRPLLNVVSALFSSLASQRHIRLSVHLSPFPLPVSHDPDQLEKVMTNLLSNAFKFTPDGGEITLSGGPVQVHEQDFVELTVDDSGIGVAPDQATQVFERFYQGTAPQQDRQPGTGVGLSLVKEIVELHGGTIRIDPKSTPGARIVVCLPMATLTTPASELAATESTPNPVVLDTSFEVDDSLPIAESEATALQISSPDQTTMSQLPLLLIVDDNDDIRQFIREQMKRTYRVLERENGQLGLLAAQENLPDLIISDWMMPDMDGIEFCQRIKTDERTNHIPFILLTALATQDKRLTGLETGADDYLTKPFDARELLLRTQNLIASRQMLHDRFSREIRVQPQDITVTSADEKFLTRIIRIVEENMSNPEFNVEQFGREVGLSRMQLHRKLLSLTGQSSGDFIRLMRLKRAGQLLEGRAGNVSEIAYGVGFNSLSYFTKCFREQFGVLPSDYLETVTLSDTGGLV